MPSVSKQIENWLKPLRLEEKQKFTNRAVVGGLDRYIVKGCEQILAGPMVDRTFKIFLKQLRRDFSQYMTLSVEERKELVRKSIDELQKLSKNFPESAPVKMIQSKLRL